MTEDKWLRIRKAPKDTDDPWVIAARRRLDRGSEIIPLLVDLDESVPFIDSVDAPGALDGFRALRCEVKELDVRGMDERTLLRELGVLYGFPEDYEPNWSSYNDCYVDFLEAGDTPVVMAIRGFGAWRENDFRLFIRTVYELEAATEGFRRDAGAVIPRRVVNLYIGDWD
ncbi:hypothetical protein KGQ20_00105 [Catenulispora sp. NF23]|uniref:Barstar (barnase inhibitor) domain-containing protein n=1 Tax=Catenulispora pinistramenti TaxID=2705254 RepID=A0ABS5KK08_9ACTN|nr:hypothetical protein [Catenulispora pinistramenti]MBS2531167.1 hypothetical protein [Catenulispora pinistramenti]MBS2545929.1 hypothetical protein [Catenulispora pinistramenti]